MNRVLRSALGGLLAASVFAFAPAAHADFKVAVVDVQRAVMQTEDGMRAQATLKKLFDSRQQELNRKQQDLLKQKEEIEKQAKVLPKDALQKKMDEWQKAMSELQAVFVQYNQEIEKEQKKATDPIFEKILGIVKRVALNKGYDLIIDKQTVAYMKSDLDLTDQCIQLYNSGAGGGDVPPKK